MLNLYFNGNIGQYMAPINMETDPDIKRIIRTDIIDVSASLILSLGEGRMTGAANDSQPADNNVIGSLNLLHRTGKDTEETLGTVIALKGLAAIPTMGMSPGEVDMAINIMIATLQVQQWLEKVGILDPDPGKDPDDLRILVEVADGEPVARVLGVGEEVALVWESR